ncbi:MAG: enoyl-CoA hydratase/isomerase family protein [Proteobacteria bacterium]|nr:enoyl-CoA hydratase/isomerase family protein [Pseudomonadota bacterium]
MPDVIVDLQDHGSRGRVATVTIDNRDRLNAVDDELIAKATEAVARFQNDEELRVMVLAGYGERAFIGGVDINLLNALTSSTAEDFITRLHGLCQAIRDLPVPVIARVSGYCLGGGLEVAAACDLRVASSDSVFGMPEVKVGLPSVIEAALLPRLIGWGKTCELVYTGLNISADEALRTGLVERVVSPGELDKAADQWVEAILASGPRAIRLQKALLSRWETLPLGQAIEQGIKSFGQAYRTSEPQDQMRGFFERRKNSA